MLLLMTTTLRSTLVSYTVSYFSDQRSPRRVVAAVLVVNEMQIDVSGQLIDSCRRAHDQRIIKDTEKL